MPLNQLLARVILRPILRPLARAFGVKLRHARRQEIADALAGHGLDERQLESLKPYVGMAVDFAGISGRFNVFVHALAIPVGLFLLWFLSAIEAPGWFLLAALALIAYVVYDTWVNWRMLRTAIRLRERLPGDPEGVLRDRGRYDWALSKWRKRTNLDRAYPDELVEDPTIEREASLLYPDH